ncbi:hypothetical protein [Methylobacterium sp. P1-11]|uniref:hypothetical protein n=1 Tax=Methylobacterium sp. P1-11 TaxID=2024616 RepID=UPI0011EFD4D3|nr:hypothetical protein [Methylobacterium sp. P1-11]
MAVRNMACEGATDRYLGYNLSHTVIQGSSMITDEEMEDLPADPELAFVAVEKILRSKIEEHEFDARNNDLDPDPYRLEYMTRVLAAARAYNIDALSELKMPRASRQSIYEFYAQFRNDVDFVTMQIRLNAQRINREGSVGLDPKAKSKIHHFIQQIRDEIEQSDLDIDKKESLLDALNAFAKEVDRTRTRMQVAMALWIAFASGVGSGFEKLKPVRDLLDSIARVMGNAKALEDHYTKKLPKPTDRKRLEPPPAPPAEPPAPEIDDIPF